MKNASKTPGGRWAGPVRPARGALVRAGLFALGVVGLNMAPGMAHAATTGASGALVGGLSLASPAVGGDDAALQARCAALKAELDRKTAEITALKRGDRTLRQDRDLRERMAEANELARQLTALESELAHRPNPPAGGAPGPTVAPVEASASLQARADLLSDEATKLSERAAGMIRAAGQMRSRQALKRRAANVERDPFASLDGSKRLLFVRAAPLRATDGKAATPVPTSGPGSESAGAGGTSAGGPMTTASPATPPPSGPTPPATLAPPTTPTTPMAPGNPSTTTPQDAAGNKGATAASPTASGRSELAPGALLDPALRAELARMGFDPAAAAGPEALEQAAATLSNRAQTLLGQAKALRAQAAQR